MPVTTDLEGYREEIRAFLDENLPADWAGLGALDDVARGAFVGPWRQLLFERNYLAPTWPAEFGGGGLDEAHASILESEFAFAGVPLMPWPSDFFGFGLIGPTIMHWGTPEQKAFFIPRILSGEHQWAQGYSEPGAGSDLFSLRTKGELVGDEWRLNGQKVWQTAGDTANWIFVLTRTEPDAPKSKGLSLLLVPIDQAGVEVRPIRTMTGDAEFCEFFFTDARTDAANIVGKRGEGAKVALTLLGFERSSGNATSIVYHQELDRITELARANGKIEDAGIRQRIAWCYSKVELLRMLGLKSAELASAGVAPGPESSIFKLYDSEYHSRVTELAIDVLGMEGQVTSGRGPVAALGADPLGSPSSTAAWQAVYLRARAATIYGGSSQIQRTTLAERVLGMPREPRPTPQAGRQA
jgi:alkylation response protein AidB-like acyl-CoA dehydrogenase